MNGETLVRDGIRAWQEETGDTRPVRQATAEELPDLFRRKLQEELAEYLESGNFEELCDLIDVAYACATRVHRRSDVNDSIRFKRNQRGAFSTCYVLGEREGKG